MIPKCAQEQTERVRFEGDIGVHEERDRAARGATEQIPGDRLPGTLARDDDHGDGRHRSGGASLVAVLHERCVERGGERAYVGQRLARIRTVEADGDLERPSSRPRRPAPALPRERQRTTERGLVRPARHGESHEPGGVRHSVSKDGSKARQARRTRP